MGRSTAVPQTAVLGKGQPVESVSPYISGCNILLERVEARFPRADVGNEIKIFWRDVSFSKTGTSVLGTNSNPKSLKTRHEFSSMGETSQSTPTELGEVRFTLDFGRFDENLFPLARFVSLPTSK